MELEELNLESIQNENREFDLKKIKKLIYEVEYYHDIIKEHAESINKVKQDIYYYKGEFQQNHEKYLNCIENIKELELQIEQLDEKKIILDGRVSKKDHDNREFLEQQIEQLNEEKEEAKNNRINSKLAFIESKDVFNKIKDPAIQESNEKFFNDYKQELIQVFEYCLTSKKEIDFKLNNTLGYLEKEKEDSTKEKYLKNYFELVQTKEKFYDNYSKVLEMISNYPFDDSIIDLLEEASKRVDSISFKEQKIVIDDNTLNTNNEEAIDNSIKESEDLNLDNNVSENELLEQDSPLNNEIEENNTDNVQNPEDESVMDNDMQESEINNSNKLNNIFMQDYVNNQENVTSEEIENSNINHMHSPLNITDWDDEVSKNITKDTLDQNIEESNIKPKAILEDDKWIDDDVELESNKELSSDIIEEKGEPILESSGQNLQSTSNDSNVSEDQNSNNILPFNIINIKDAKSDLIDKASYKFHKFWFSEEKFDEWQNSNNYSK